MTVVIPSLGGGNWAVIAWMNNGEYRRKRDMLIGTLFVLILNAEEDQKRCICGLLVGWSTTIDVKQRSSDYMFYHLTHAETLGPYREPLPYFLHVYASPT